MASFSFPDHGQMPARRLRQHRSGQGKRRSGRDGERKSWPAPVGQRGVQLLCVFLQVKHEKIDKYNVFQPVMRRFARPQRLGCRFSMNPVCCDPRAVAVVRSALPRRPRSDGSPAGPLLQGKVRGIVRQAVAIRKPRGGRTRTVRRRDASPSWPGVRPFDGSMAHRPPRAKEAARAAGCSHRWDLGASGASPWHGVCSLMPATRRKRGWSS